ncbi:MAG: DUF3293 domain-containing protein, partial [Planctomycetes bacterium]|nr:DUF3293 domain-containing protein [Planctomycetota bacterium]
SSGNGSIMRLAAIAIRFADSFPGQLVELSRLAAESSLTTHASPQCLSACRYLALVLCGLIHGLPRDEVLDPRWKLLRELEAIEPLHPSIAEVAQGSFRIRQPPEIVGSGYVVKSLEAALWAFCTSADFAEAVLRSVNLGDDADTTGAVCGQLAGAYWGEAGIPADWLKGLARRDMIEQVLRGLALRSAYEATSYWVDDAPGGSFALRCGAHCRELDTLLSGAGQTSWIYITACNPQSERLSEAENEQRLHALTERLLLRQPQTVVYHGRGVGQAGDWPAEPSLLVLGLDAAQGQMLAREFGQTAFLAGRAGQRVELVWTATGDSGRQEGGDSPRRQGR